MAGWETSGGRPEMLCPCTHFFVHAEHSWSGCGGRRTTGATCPTLPNTRPSAAPTPHAAILAALGHPPFECIVCLLIMTSCIGPFGSSGIGLWFGLSALEWSRAQLVHVTFLVAVCMAVVSACMAVVSACMALVSGWRAGRMPSQGAAAGAVHAQHERQLRCTAARQAGELGCCATRLFRAPSLPPDQLVASTHVANTPLAGWVPPRARADT